MVVHDIEREPREPPISDSGLPVTFFIAGDSDVEALKSIEPGRVFQYCRKGEFAWVVQTYLRLREAGYPVDLAEIPPREGIVVFHAKQKHLLARAVKGNDKLIFVGIRADDSAPLLADFEILQNRWFEDGIRRFQIPFWPQPNILPRDPSRGTRVERIGYMGLIENLAPEFRGDTWAEKVSGLGMEWIPQMARFREMSDPARVNWEDYRDVDVLLAVRPRERALTYAKPASKLINAWRAGVPILVGPEYPYRELKRKDDDFIEVSGGAAALEALRRLRCDSDRYVRMVNNGHHRAREFTESEITRQWAELMFQTIPARVGADGLHWTHGVPLGFRLPLRRFLRIARGERSR